MGWKVKKTSTEFYLITCVYLLTACILGSMVVTLASLAITSYEILFKCVYVCLCTGDGTTRMDSHTT